MVLPKGQPEILLYGFYLFHNVVHSETYEDHIPASHLCMAAIHRLSEKDHHVVISFCILQDLHGWWKS